MLTKKNFLSVSIAALAISGLFVLACGDDDNTGTTPTGNDSGTTADTSTTPKQDSGNQTPTDSGSDVVTPTGPGITVNVTYAGTGTGDVRLALFSGACASLGPTSVPTKTAPVFQTPVTFPIVFKFDDVGAGTYCATSYLDIGGNNAQGSGAEDPKGGAQVTFAGADVSATITLHDPAPADGGADGGDGG